jgi:KDO2-lipid IV(A) lauroyltransferase
VFFYYLWRVALAVFPYIPRRLGYPIGLVAAAVAWFFWPRARRRAMVENYRRVLGPSRQHEAKRVARASVMNYFRYLIDLSRFHHEAPEDIEKRVIFDGWGMIEEAHAKGNGLILALMHFGFWDLGGAIMVQHGYPMNAVAESLEHAKLNELIQGARAFKGIKIIPLEKAASGIVRALKRDETVAILIDRPVPGAGVPVRFFGAPTEIPAGAATIALRTGAPIMAVGLVRISREHILGLVEPIPFPETGDLPADVRELTQRIMAAHERIIRRYPDQWYKFRAMWPDGVAEPAAGVGTSSGAESAAAAPTGPGA